jgi:hypothetical protein
MDGNEANSFSSLVRAIRFVHPVEALREKRKPSRPEKRKPHNGIHRRRRKKITW